MKKKDTIPYTVEREFLGKTTVKELLICIINTHLNAERQKRNLI